MISYTQVLGRVLGQYPIAQVAAQQSRRAKVCWNYYCDEMRENKINSVFFLFH